MIQAAATTISDELQLAQLACAKLARLVQGAVSIGLPAFTTGTPEPGTFLRDRFRVMHAFVIVLHNASSPMGNSQETLRIREKSSKLLSLMADFERQLLMSLDRSGTPLSKLQSAHATASALFDVMADYARLVRLDGDLILNAKTVVMDVFAAMEKLDSAHALSTS